MRIIVNGQAREIQIGSVEAVLEAEYVPRGDWNASAVARNGNVIPKSAWNNITFNENDRIEIVRPFAGG